MQWRCFRLKKTPCDFASYGVMLIAYSFIKIKGQLFGLSDYLAARFSFERIVYKFSAGKSFSDYSAVKAKHFFVVNQR